MRPDVNAAVERRDRGCVAPLIGGNAVGPCYDEWGYPMSRTDLAKCERDHWHYAGRGKNRANAEAWQIVIGCPGHHRGTGPVRPGQGWLTANRDKIADYIDRWLEKFHVETDVGNT
jgi:hypothetical protein